MAVPTRRLTALLIMLMAASLGACATSKKSQPEPSAYDKAIMDAALAEADEISTDLVPIAAWNDKIVWKGSATHRQVLMVAFTASDDLGDKLGNKALLEQDTWVTVAPQVHDFCRAQTLDAEAMAARLRQALGLPPEGDEAYFVELWLDPADLLRPCPDPEITDRECELDYPGSWKFVQISDDHRRWFETARAGSYGKNGRPWTRLGYTYDWGNPESEVGLSEFVIPAQTTVEVRSLMPAGEYCVPSPEKAEGEGAAAEKKD